MVHTLLEVMTDDGEEDKQSLRASDEYFRQGGKGVPFEQVVTDLGFTMEQICGSAGSAQE